MTQVTINTMDGGSITICATTHTHGQYANLSDATHNSCMGTNGNKERSQGDHSPRGHECHMERQLSRGKLSTRKMGLRLQIPEWSTNTGRQKPLIHIHKRRRRSAKNVNISRAAQMGNDKYKNFRGLRKQRTRMEGLTDHWPIWSQYAVHNPAQKVPKQEVQQ